MSQSWAWVGLLVAGIACLPYLVSACCSRVKVLHGSHLEGKSQSGIGARGRSAAASGDGQGYVERQRSHFGSGGDGNASVNCLHKWESVDVTSAPAPGCFLQRCSHAMLRKLFVRIYAIFWV